MEAGMKGRQVSVCCSYNGDGFVDVTDLGHPTLAFLVGASLSERHRLAFREATHPAHSLCLPVLRPGAEATFVYSASPLRLFFIPQPTPLRPYQHLFVLYVNPSLHLPPHSIKLQLLTCCSLSRQRPAPLSATPTVRHPLYVVPSPHLALPSATRSTLCIASYSHSTFTSVMY